MLGKELFDRVKDNLEKWTVKTCKPVNGYLIYEVKLWKKMNEMQGNEQGQNNPKCIHTMSSE